MFLNNILPRTFRENIKKLALLSVEGIPVLKCPFDLVGHCLPIIWGEQGGFSQRRIDNNLPGHLNVAHDNGSSYGQRLCNREWHSTFGKRWIYRKVSALVEAASSTGPRDERRPRQIGWASTSLRQSIHFFVCLDRGPYCAVKRNRSMMKNNTSLTNGTQRAKVV